MHINKYYFNIGDFAIAICFYPVEWLTFKQKLEREIIDYLKEFSLKDKPKKIDFRINFMWKQNLDILLKNNDNKINYYVCHSMNGTEKDIICFYWLSVAEFQFILKNIISMLLSDHNGFILHASSVEINNKANTFLGYPTAGKSTARQLLSGKYRSLADDSAIIRKIGDTYYFYQSPFLEPKVHLKRSSRRWILDKVFFLKKRNYFKINKITNRSTIVKRVTRQFFTTRYFEKRQMKNILQFIADFSEFYWLYFAKKSDGLIKLFK